MFPLPVPATLAIGQLVRDQADSQGAEGQAGPLSATSDVLEVLLVQFMRLRRGKPTGSGHFVNGVLQPWVEMWVDDAPIAFDQCIMQENPPSGVLSTARANRAAM